MTLIHTKALAGVVTVRERVEADHPTVPGGKVLLARAGQQMPLVEAVRVGIDVDLLDPVGAAGKAALTALRNGADADQAEKAAQDVRRTERSQSTAQTDGDDGEDGDADLASWVATVDGVGVAAAEKIATALDGWTVADLADLGVDGAVEKLVEVDGIGEATASRIAAALDDGDDGEDGDA